MLIDLIDRLRCPIAHEEICLVATAIRTANRRILDGILGCPVCGAEFAIREGEAWFGDEEIPPAAVVNIDLSDEALRLSALLALEEPGELHVLAGSWSALANELGRFVPTVLLLLSPPPGLTRFSTLRAAGDFVPLAAGCAKGVAIDRPSTVLATAAAQILATRGRLIAPASTAVPASIRLLALDDRHWVGERLPSPDQPVLVTPQRARPAGATP